MIVDVNSPITWGVTWRCMSIKCWFRPKYKPSKNLNKERKTTLEYTTGYVKAINYLQDVVSPANSIMMTSDVYGATKVKRQTKFPKFVTGILGLRNKDMLNSAKIGKNLDETPSFYVLDLRPMGQNSQIDFDQNKNYGTFTTFTQSTDEWTLPVTALRITGGSNVSIQTDAVISTKTPFVYIP